VPCPPSASAAGYMKGFGGQYSTEALKGALPARGNGPQHVSGPWFRHSIAALPEAVFARRFLRVVPWLIQVAYGLYAEQLNGTAFTCPRATNQRT
jgi:homogentisate 1,2-dioxygenase